MRRTYEDPGYDTVRGIETCALHAADFMYKIYRNELVNSGWEHAAESLAGKATRHYKNFQTGLPAGQCFIIKPAGGAFTPNDVGIVDDGKIKYIISVLLPFRRRK